MTPFAQILATLKDVRSNLAKMLSTQEPREAREGRERSPSILNSNTPYLDNFRLSGKNCRCFFAAQYCNDPDAGATKVMGILAVDTLESMDWCLEKLEHLQTNRAVGDMAADKFKMLLNRELSVMSQSSNEGRNISKHFTDTYCGKYHCRSHIRPHIAIKFLLLCMFGGHMKKFGTKSETIERGLRTLNFCGIEILPHLKAQK